MKKILLFICSIILVFSTACSDNDNEIIAEVDTEFVIVLTQTGEQYYTDEFSILAPSPNVPSQDIITFEDMNPNSSTYREVLNFSTPNGTPWVVYRYNNSKRYYGLYTSYIRMPDVIC